jgi:hypothetical protein
MRTVRSKTIETGTDQSSRARNMLPFPQLNQETSSTTVPSQPLRPSKPFRHHLVIIIHNAQRASPRFGRLSHESKTPFSLFLFEFSNPVIPISILPAAKSKNRRKKRQTHAERSCIANLEASFLNLRTILISTFVKPSMKPSLPMTPHALPSAPTSTPIRNSRHAPRASSVSAQVNTRDFSAQIGISIVAARSRFVVVAAHFAVRHTRRTLIESARVLLGVRIRDRNHGIGWSRIEIGPFAQWFCGAAGRSGGRGFEKVVASWRSRLRGLLGCDLGLRGVGGGGAAAEVDDGVV